jgi:1A family penicillin-binding protein
MGDFLRGEYDQKKVERARAALRRATARTRATVGPAWAWVRASALPDDAAGAHEREPIDGHRVVLIVAVITLAATALSVAFVPPAALLGRAARNLNDRFGPGPSGRVVLPQIAQRSLVIARDGSTIAVLTGEEDRKVVSIAEIPTLTQQAVLAIEDARFYEHHGIDTNGILRAVFANASSGDVRQGGSTITQQLVKNTVVGTKRTLDRKIKEAQYAVALERSMPKRRILEIYLNEAYFGNGVYGVATAAELYFGKPVKRLALAESALLAGLISSPTHYDPLKNPDAARRRRSLVLQRMAEEGFITAAGRAKAEKAPLGAKRHVVAKIDEPYFVEFVKQQLLNDGRLGETRQERIRAVFYGGLRIQTTLDPVLQDAAKKAVEDTLDRPSDPSAALVSIDPTTGALRAMVSGRDFSKNKYDLAVQGRRQPGSTFKPIALVAALDAGFAPTLTLDTPSPIAITDPLTNEKYEVPNYDEKGHGYIDLRKATEESVNTYYAQLTLKVGRDKIVDMAHKLGIVTDVKPYLSIALGAQIVSPYEMASVYATLANQGTRCKPFEIIRVTDSNGKPLIANQPECERTVDGSVAAAATDVLRGVVERGTGKRAQIGRPAAGKTGTTDEYTDAWFSGYTPQYATVVWMGYPQDNRKKLHNIHGFAKVCGGCLPAAIWKEYMTAAHKGLPKTEFPKPPPIPQVDVPDVTTKLQADAMKTLQDAGFTVKVQPVKSSLAQGIVVAQTPPGATKANPGVLVTIQVSDGTGSGPTPSPSPSPTPSPSPSPTPSESPSPEPSPTGKKT